MSMQARIFASAVAGLAVSIAACSPGGAEEGAPSASASPVTHPVDPKSCIDSDTIFNPNSASSIAQWSSDIFSAKVDKVNGSMGLGPGDPKTKITVTITKAYKGKLAGTVTLAEPGTNDCLVNGVPIVTPGLEYIFATNGNAEPLLEIWHGAATPKNDEQFSAIK